MSAPAPQVSAWDDFVLRLIASWKLLHALFFAAAGIGLLRLKHHNVVEFLNTHIIIPYHLNPEDQFVDWMLAEAGRLAPHLVLLGWTFFLYASLFALEGIGLFLRKHWAEYLVVIVTASLLPLEVYELCIGVAWWKFAAVVGNVAIVAYLVHRLRSDARFKAQQVRESQESETPSPTARTKSVVNEVP